MGAKSLHRCCSWAHLTQKKASALIKCPTGVPAFARLTKWPLEISPTISTSVEIGYTRREHASVASIPPSVSTIACDQSLTLQYKGRRFRSLQGEFGFALYLYIVSRCRFGRARTEVLVTGDLDFDRSGNRTMLAAENKLRLPLRSFSLRDRKLWPSSHIAKMGERRGGGRQRISDDYSFNKFAL